MGAHRWKTVAHVLAFLDTGLSEGVPGPACPGSPRSQAVSLPCGRRMAQLYSRAALAHETRISSLEIGISVQRSWFGRYRPSPHF